MAILNHLTTQTKDENVNTFKLAIVTSALALAACQTVPYQGQAREVKRKSGRGGVIAIPVNSREEDRKVATAKMDDACGEFAVRILEETEVVVGTKSTSNARNTNRDDSRRDEGRFLGINLVSGEAGGTDSKVETATEAVKEWQMTYECSLAKKAKI